ncbi:MAG: hypothetical protein R2788_03480 [Saprospiraceae bacterium]
MESFDDFPHPPWLNRMFSLGKSWLVGATCWFTCRTNWLLALFTACKKRSKEKGFNNNLQRSKPKVSKVVGIGGGKNGQRGGFFSVLSKCFRSMLAFGCRGRVDQLAGRRISVF